MTALTTFTYPDALADQTDDGLDIEAIQPTEDEMVEGFFETGIPERGGSGYIAGLPASHGCK